MSSRPDTRRIGFPPIVDQRSRVLILGSMPGARSLTEQRYYAHPYNTFWPIMGRLVGAHPELPYRQRIARLRASHIALWDVLADCERAGSLDTAIDPRSAIANDFAAFFARYPNIKQVFFNGTAAELWFKRRVRPTLSVEAPPAIRLPSTSPAHAGRSLAQKLAAWQVVRLSLATP
jgi:TDG/mug DNA glycosylase family protein